MNLQEKERKKGEEGRKKRKREGGRKNEKREEERKKGRKKKREKEREKRKRKGIKIQRKSEKCSCLTGADHQEEKVSILHCYLTLQMLLNINPH